MKTAVNVLFPILLFTSSWRRQWPFISLYKQFFITSSSLTRIFLAACENKKTRQVTSKFKKTFSRELDIFKSSSRILQCWSYDVKLTLQDINTTPKEPKTERDCSHRQLLRYYCSSSVWRNNREALLKNNPHTLTQNSNTHRTTPYHVSPGGQDSKFQVDVSQRKCIRLAKTNLSCSPMRLMFVPRVNAA